MAPSALRRAGRAAVRPPLPSTRSAGATLLLFMAFPLMKSPAQR